MAKRCRKSNKAQRSNRSIVFVAISQGSLRGLEISPEADFSVAAPEAELVAEDAAFERAEDALHLAKVRGKGEMLPAATKMFEAF